MERLTIDMEGARFGELSAASLQLGDDTIAIQRIATMSVEAHQFLPYDTPGNKQTKGVFATLFVFCLFVALMSLSFWALVAAGTNALLALGMGIGFSVLSLFFGFKTLQYERRLKKQVPYYRLLIGTSDGRQIPLVDDNRDVLVKIRDVVRQKMDTNDTSITGTFDLNLDIVDIHDAKADLSAEPTPETVEAPEPDIDVEAEKEASAPAILFGTSDDGLKDVS